MGMGQFRDTATPTAMGLVMEYSMHRTNQYMNYE